MAPPHHTKQHFPSRLPPSCSLHVTCAASFSPRFCGGRAICQVANFLFPKGRTVSGARDDLLSPRSPSCAALPPRCDLQRVRAPARPGRTSRRRQGGPRGFGSAGAVPRRHQGPDARRQRRLPHGAHGAGGGGAPKRPERGAGTPQGSEHRRTNYSTASPPGSQPLAPSVIRECRCTCRRPGYP